VLYTCNGVGDCAADCGAASTCDLSCTGGGLCTLHCAGTDNCQMNCPAEGGCILVGGHGDDLHCGAEPVIDCGGGVFACKAECPVVK
jgi:hypothetical protein